MAYTSIYPLGISTDLQGGLSNVFSEKKWTREGLSSLSVGRGPGYNGTGSSIFDRISPHLPQVGDEFKEDP